MALAFRNRCPAPSPGTRHRGPPRWGRTRRRATGEHGRRIGLEARRGLLRDFVRSFYDSDGDGIGDLNGLIEKLDYINDGDPAAQRDLGAPCIWLMPIVASPSYHGYDATDYYRVNTDYGTNEDFARLVAEAHRRGIRVLVDMVLNHASSEHPYFKHALLHADSPYRDWFSWSPTDPAITGPWGQQVWHRSPVREEYYYGIFWSGMPDLNYENPAVQEEARKIARFWLEEMGADGFRLPVLGGAVAARRPICGARPARRAGRRVAFARCGWPATRLCPRPLARTSRDPHLRPRRHTVTRRKFRIAPIAIDFPDQSFIRHIGSGRQALQQATSSAFRDQPQGVDVTRSEKCEMPMVERSEFPLSKPLDHGEHRRVDEADVTIAVVVAQLTDADVVLRSEAFDLIGTRYDVSEQRNQDARV